MSATGGKATGVACPSLLDLARQYPLLWMLEPELQYFPFSPLVFSLTLVLSRFLQPHFPLCSDTVHLGPLHIGSNFLFDFSESHS